MSRMTISLSLSPSLIQTLSLLPHQAGLEAEIQTTRDVWKRLYFDSKAETLPLDAQVQGLKDDLEKYRDDILKRMKTKVVERSKQRLTAEAALKKRYDNLTTTSKTTTSKTS